MTLKFKFFDQIILLFYFVVLINLMSISIPFDKEIRGTSPNPLSLQPRKLNLKIQRDSPRTINACKDLGIDPEYFKLRLIQISTKKNNNIFIVFRTFESFADPHVKDKIQKMRYDHYLDRLLRKK